MRTAEISRQTKETDLTVQLSLEGGEIRVNTGIGFFDHMLISFAAHAGFGLIAAARGDLFVDGHHTVEDTGIVLGLALARALGDKKGIARFADCCVPMDEALAFCAVDVSGRPYLKFDAVFEQEKAGDYSTCLTEEFFRAFAFNAGITLHTRVLYGTNSHHKTEALFKAAAKALKAAVKIESETLPSTKGVLA